MILNFLDAFIQHLYVYMQLMRTLIHKQSVFEVFSLLKFVSSNLDEDMKELFFTQTKAIFKEYKTLFHYQNPLCEQDTQG